MQVMYALQPIPDDIHSVSIIPCLQKTVLSPFQLFIPLHIHIAVLSVDSKNMQVCFISQMMTNFEVCHAQMCQH